MKKFFILASAAIVALASCSKTQVVYNDAPEEIGFKAVTGAMTKAEDPISNLINLGVYAYFTDSDPVGKNYLNNVKFTHAGDNVWSGGKYWPVSGTLSFVLYAPYVGSEGTPSSVTYDYASKTLSIAEDNRTNQNDWLYGTTQPAGTKATSETSMAVSMKHALSQVVVNVSGDDVIYLKKVELKKTHGTATGAVVYAENAGKMTAGNITWNSHGNVDNTGITIFNNDAGLKLTGIGNNAAGITTRLVIPTTLTDETIKLTYKIGSTGSDLYYETDPAKGDPLTQNQLGAEWVAGTKYTYNFSIGAKEIKFTPTEAPWDNGGTGIEVTPNVN